MERQGESDSFVTAYCSVIRSAVDRKSDVELTDAWTA